MSKKVLMITVFVLALLISLICYATEQEDQNMVFDNTVRSHPMNAIDVPERDINLKINNLNRGCRVYLYLPVDMLKYNIDKFVNNNDNNPFLIEDWESDDLKDLLKEGKYIEYIEYFSQFGFKKESNEIELRHYSFCLDSVELIDYVEYNNNKYVSFKIFPNEDNEFKIVTKDYFTNYNSNNIVFMIDEYGEKSYIDLSGRGFTVNPGHPNITEMNVVYDFESHVDADEIERITKLVYMILLIILIIIVLIILIAIIRHHKKKKQEIEDRKFWKKKETKEEIKERKKRKKEETKELLKEIKSKKHKKR